MKQKIFLGAVSLLILALLWRVPLHNFAGGSSLISRDFSADMDRNGSLEQYVLSAGRVEIFEDGRNVWTSPADWTVQDMALADVDGDKITDVAMSVWKPGDFGKFRPFWVQNNDPRIRNHLFVFDYREGKLAPIWQSSNLDRPNCEIAFAKLGQSDTSRLLVIEGEYQDGLQCLGKYLATWEWNGWGFGNIWRSISGDYRDIEAHLNEFQAR